jgi:hypothetical protein
MAVAEVSTAADLADFTVADLADFTAAGSADFTATGSTEIDFAIADFSSVDCTHIRGWAITRTTGIMIIVNLTPLRLGTTAPILPVITLM